jgi:hypothetical protein
LPHRQTLDERFVSVLLPALSRYVFAGVAGLLCGRSFLKRSSSLRSKAVRQFTNPNNEIGVVWNKNFGTESLQEFTTINILKKLEANSHLHMFASSHV